MTTDKTTRKESPIARGVLDYFPDAIAAVAHCSYVGNQQHNPGEELHWAREKSKDHADCIARHLMERGTLDSDGVSHSAKVAWRALAMLQLEAEGEHQGPAHPPEADEEDTLGKYQGDWDLSAEDMRQCRGEGCFWRVAGSEVRRVSYDGCEEAKVSRISLREAMQRIDSGWWTRVQVPVRKTQSAESNGNDSSVTTATGYKATFANSLDSGDFMWLVGQGCKPKVAEAIVRGITRSKLTQFPYVYIAGPMRGHPDSNFLAFDTRRDEYVKYGYTVVSPADIDRASTTAEKGQAGYAYRDIFALQLVNYRSGKISMLDGWEFSAGALAEFAFAQWLGIPVWGKFGYGQLRKDQVNSTDLCGAIASRLS